MIVSIILSSKEKAFINLHYFRDAELITTSQPLTICSHFLDNAISADQTVCACGFPVYFKMICNIEEGTLLIYVYIILIIFQKLNLQFLKIEPTLTNFEAVQVLVQFHIKPSTSTALFTNLIGLSELHLSQVKLFLINEQRVRKVHAVSTS
jgi:hypothetical protein